MKILFISPNPPDHLNRIRALNIINALSSDHELHLACLVTSLDDLENVDKSIYTTVTPIVQPKIKAYLNCVWRFFLPEPLESAYCYSPEMKKAIERIVKEQNIDLIYIKRTRMAQYGLRHSNIKTVLDLTDSMEMHYGRTLKTVDWHKRLLYIEEWLKYRYYERKIIQKYDKCVVCSEVDKQFLKTRNNTSNLYVVPNIVDTTYFYPRTDEEEPLSLMFSGLMDKQVNINGAEFLLDEIYPLIRQQYPHIRLYIVGPNPPSHIQAYARQDENIIVTGYVSDIRDYIARSTIVVVPIRVGAGTRNKILQAMAMKKPVVSTTIGAEGLEVIEDSICIADNPQEFADKVIKLLADEGYRLLTSENGYLVVNTNYNMNALRNSLYSILTPKIQTTS